MFDPNITVLEMMVANLAELVDKFIFVGGATVGIYIDDKAVPKIRTTIDIDCVVEAANKTQFYAIADRLRELGFLEDPTENIVCRFKKGALILDVMPSEEGVLSFTNRWYQEGIKASTKVKLPSGREISVFTLPYFIAAKIEAFRGRGKDDYYASHDIEDIVAVIDGSLKFVEACKTGSAGVLHYLRTFFNAAIEHPDFLGALEGHITDRNISAARARIVLDRINKIL